MPTCSDDHLIVADAIEYLSPDLRAELAKGPMEEPSCRICRTLGQRPYVSDSEQTIIAFHDMGDDQLAEAIMDVLGKDQRLSRDQLAAAKAYERKLERLPERNIQRRTVEALCEGIMWWRCLYVYAVAGWKP